MCTYRRVNKKLLAGGSGMWASSPHPVYWGNKANSKSSDAQTMPGLKVNVKKPNVWAVQEVRLCLRLHACLHTAIPQEAEWTSDQYRTCPIQEQSQSGQFKTKSRIIRQNLVGAGECWVSLCSSDSPGTMKTRKASKSKKPAFAGVLSAGLKVCTTTSC